MSKNKFSADELLVQKKLEIEFGMNYILAYNMIISRGITTFTELYNWYKESAKVVDECKEVMCMFDDDMISLILGKSVSAISRSYTDGIFSENGYRKMSTYNKAVEMLGYLKHRLTIADEEKQIRLAKELSAKLNDLNTTDVSTLLGWTKPRATILLWNINALDTTVDITDILENVLKHISSIEKKDRMIKKQFTFKRKTYDIDVVSVPKGNDYIVASILSIDGKKIAVTQIKKTKDYSLLVDSSKAVLTTLGV